MTELTEEIENLDRAMILEAVEFEPVKQGRSLVVTIGINEYVHWQKLKNAVQDAIGLQQTLIDKLGFSAPIPPLLNEAATKAAIESLIEDQLREELQEDDNLVLFFAGHGHTRTDKVGGKVVGETGFIVPVEARGPKEYWSDYIQIDPLLQSISRLPARHILVILDSCHSGFALGEAMKSFRDAVRYERDLSNRISRKVITSARREQLALDGGPIPGHSLFTGTLVDGFNWGKADLDGNGLITSSELGLFIQQQVAQASQSNQTPDFGSFYFDDRGEMVISLRNQSFDALKARAFSALQSGNFTTFSELVDLLIKLKASSPETLYLEYRLRFFERNFERVIEIIENLLTLNPPVGLVPLSSDDLWVIREKLDCWKSLLTIAQSEFPLKVTVMVGSAPDEIEIAEQPKTSNEAAYYIEYQNTFYFRINNFTEETIHVYMVSIDVNGRFSSMNLWQDAEVLLNGLSPGATKLTYIFVQKESRGLVELRLFSSPKRVDFFLFPADNNISYGSVIEIEDEDLKTIKMKSIRYTAQKFV
ncbi:MULTISPECIES: caspase family protein [unclassified Microcoleus]|uniref:caspase family protein n=1 Tax=unclassified Microcoleus TaxID=2642155 RepID=UPI002FD452D8